MCIYIYIFIYIYMYYISISHIYIYILYTFLLLLLCVCHGLGPKKKKRACQGIQALSLQRASTTSSSIRRNSCQVRDGQHCWWFGWCFHGFQCEIHESWGIDAGNRFLFAALSKSKENRGLHVFKLLYFFKVVATTNSWPTIWFDER